MVVMLSIRIPNRMFCLLAPHGAVVTRVYVVQRWCLRVILSVEERREKIPKLRLHPHLHIIIPAGGLSLDHTRWVHSRDNYFLPKPVLRKVFRGKFVPELNRAFQNGELRFPEKLKLLAQPKMFAAWLRPLFRQHWVVYLKRPFGGPEYLLQYLGRYTHRVAISNHRLVSFADGQVTFRWRDSAHHNEQKLTSLSHDKVLRRFLLHLLPQGFVRIRHFGFLACRKTRSLLRGRS